MTTADDREENDAHAAGSGAGGEPGRERPEAAATGDLEQQLRDAEDRVLRAQAELENFRKRSRREYEEALRYREIDLLRDLLPVLDTVRRAIEASASATDVESLRSGFRMTEQQLEKVLDAHGCRQIETEGKAFDPTVHDAILQQTVAGVAAGTVVGVASRGYRLHDRVVRPAQVIVSKEE